MTPGFVVWLAFVLFGVARKLGVSWGYLWAVLGLAIATDATVYFARHAA